MSDAVQDAGKLYRESLDALYDQRRQIAEDLRFSDPSNPDQWDELERRQRENDPGGARPCLVMDNIGQFVSNVAGQVEQRPPALHAIPVDGDADRKVAEQLDGFFRHVEHASRAQQHYARALTSAARAGVGYLIVRPEYTDRALNWQEPRISSEGDPLRVVFDPWSVELDGSDATYGFLLTPFSHREWEAKFGKSPKVSFGDEEQKNADARDSILAAEFWKIETVETNVIVFKRGDDESSLPEDQFWEAQKRGEQLQVQRTYHDRTQVVRWSRMSGVETLTKETVYPASGIGIVPVYGYVGWSDGRMRYCGIPRRAREPQRAYNLAISEIRAYTLTAPKSPWMVDAASVSGLEPIWDRASVETRAWLPYNSRDPNNPSGPPLPPPTRSPVAVNLANHIQAAEQALRDIQASIGMYQANLGAPSNETSGVAIDSRKQQGEASTAHFPSHLAASLGQVGKLTMEIGARVVDTKRLLRIIGIDGTVGHVTVDPSLQTPYVETETGLSINPNVGRYDVRIVVGPSFSTQRQQAQEAYTEIMRARPEMAPLIAPFWAGELDVKNSDKLQQVLTAMLPPAAKAVMAPEDDKKPTTASLMAKVDQLQQALNEAIQHAQDAQKDADEANAALQQKHMEMAAKSDELDIQEYQAETDRLKVTGANEEQIKAIVTDLINQMLTNPAPLGDEPDPPMPASADMQPFPAGPMPDSPNAEMAPEQT